MKARGFVYTLDAVFAMIAVMALAGALYTQSTLESARGDQFQELQARADENAYYSIYFGKDGNQSPNAADSQYDCVQYPKYNPNNVKQCDAQAPNCICLGDGSGAIAGAPTRCLNLSDQPFSCQQPITLPPTWTCRILQYGPDQNIVIRSMCRGSG